MNSVKRKQQKLIMGTFNSEFHWRDDKQTSLPSFTDPGAEAIVAVMDELQFVFCTEGDLLITRQPMEDCFKHYLESIGYHFDNNRYPAAAAGNAVLKNSSICSDLLKTASKTYFKELMSNTSTFSPYSVVPASQDFCEAYQIDHKLPPIEAVKKTNSKLFSHSLSKELWPDTHGTPVLSAEAMKDTGRKLLAGSAIIIKDPMGVSGKNNQIVTSENVLLRLERHIRKQEKNGSKTLFLIEPLLDKQIDFSCQFVIGQKGNVSLESVQCMDNDGLAFSGIETAAGDFVNGLEKKKYFDAVTAIAAALYKEGYHGPVCLDSMILNNGQIVPIVEINARKSMGFINYALDLYLEQFETSGKTMFIPVRVKGDFNFSAFLQALEQRELLFTPDNRSGILPLSSHTMTVNMPFKESPAKESYYPGRFYFSLVNKTTKKETTLAELKDICRALDIVVR